MSQEPATLLSIVALGIFVCVGAVLFLVWRDDQLRRSITRDEMLRAKTWRDTEAGKAVWTSIDGIDQRVRQLEHRSENQASVVDLLKFEQQMAGIRELVGVAQAGIARLEGFFLRKAINDLDGGEG